MISYQSNELVPASKFARNFGFFIAQIRGNSVDKYAVLKNNSIEAVVISKDKYEKMVEALKLVEQLQTPYINDNDEVKSNKL